MIEDIKQSQKPHQDRISSLFSGDVEFSGSKPLFDFPLCLLAFTNRCGSNVLAEYLKATNYFCGFQESLNSDVVERNSQKHDIHRFPDYIVHLTQQQSEVDKYFFIKSSWDQLLMLQEWRILKMFSGLKIVYIERLNYINQAISYVIANQTKQWTAFQEKENDTVHYDRKTIDGVIAANAKANRIFRYLFEILDFDYVHVAYENLATNPQEITNRILHNFGLDSQRNLSSYQPRHQVQANSRNQEFKQRYIEDSCDSKSH